MSAPALPRPTQETLQTELARLDNAYTLEVQYAVRSGVWGGVQAAAHAVHQARAALKQAGGEP